MCFEAVSPATSGRIQVSFLFLSKNDFVPLDFKNVIFLPKKLHF
jgi:hypothetical protein